jgi:hypothetical protein
VYRSDPEGGPDAKMEMVVGEPEGCKKAAARRCTEAIPRVGPTRI